MQVNVFAKAAIVWVPRNEDKPLSALLTSQPKHRPVPSQMGLKARVPDSGGEDKILFTRAMALPSDL